MWGCLLLCGAALDVYCVPARAEEGVQFAALADWDILIAPDAPPAVLYAAEEFRRLVGEAGVKDLAIVRQADRPGRHVIIGPGEVPGSGAAKPEAGDLGEEDIRIVIRKDMIAILGGSPRGTLYGVYAFLEKHLGVRFLTADHTHVPVADAFKVLVQGTYTFRPPFSYRECFYGPNQADHAFAARLRQNAVCHEPRLGGSASWRRLSHSIHRWVPVQRYGQEHPEYFAEIDGRRYSDGPQDNGADGTQPCMSHPDVKRLIVKGVLEAIRDDPGLMNVPVVQNDTRRYCECKTCRVIDQREKTGMGSLMAAVNRAADAVAEAHPRVQVATLAYFYSRKPPARMKPRDNVAVQVCSAEACLLHALDDPQCSVNEGFCQDLAAWRKITPNLYVWNYCVNFMDYLSPCPNLRTIGPNLRCLAAHRVKGVFMQAAGEAQATELGDLRNYLICRGMWDPSLDDKALVEEFLTLHYGKAAGAIRDYVNLVHDNAQAKRIHRGCSGVPATYGLDARIAAQGKALFARALEMAENDVVRRRVEKASITMAWAEVDPLIQWIRAHPDGGRLPSELGALRPQVLALLALCRKHGVNQVGEDVSLDTWEAHLLAALDID